MEAAADAGPNNALERFFKFKQWNTSLRRDTLAGLTTFIVMSYIIFVNPSILGLEGKGLPFAAALTSTCLVAGVMTIIMGLFTNRAYAIAPGMGLNAVVAFSLVLGQGLTFKSAMGLIFLEGVAITILVLTGFREAIFKAIPLELKKAIVVGNADVDGFLQLERDGLEDGLTEAGEHEDRDGHALEEDEAHGALKGEALAQHEAEGDDCVEAHAGGDGVGAVGEETHDDRHHAGHAAGRGECGRERQALALQTEDARVHEDDVGHDDERREPGQGVALERRVPLFELEEALQRVVRAGVSGGFHLPRPP